MIMSEQGGSMDSRRIVYKETAFVAVGELVLSAAMVGAFAALGYFKANVLWGALVGCTAVIINYFFMAVTVSLAADRAEQGNAKQAQGMIQLSSVTRLLLLGVILVAAIKLGANVVALVLPLAFERPILMLSEFFRKKGD